jgi:hypothetical protein
MTIVFTFYKYIWGFDLISFIFYENIRFKKFGKKYENDIFVGSVKNGNIFDFDLNKSRSSLVLGGSLSNKIADSQDENKNILFGIVIDLKVDLLTVTCI